MPSPKGETISAIKVGLGIDMARLSKDLGTFRDQAQSKFVITPQIGKPDPKALNAWLTSINTTVNEGGKNQKKVRVPLEFDPGQAKQAFQTAYDAVAAMAKTIDPIKIPVEYVVKGQAGGGGGTGGSGGGGGGAQPPGPPEKPTQPVAAQPASKGRGRGPRQPTTTATAATVQAAVNDLAGQVDGLQKQAQADAKTVDNAVKQAKQTTAKAKAKATGTAGGTAAAAAPASARPAGQDADYIDPAELRRTAKSGRRPPDVPRWTGRGHVMGPNDTVIQDRLGRTIRRRRNPAAAEQDALRTIGFQQALKSGDVSALEAMFPLKGGKTAGFGTAYAARDPQGMRLAYERHLKSVFGQKGPSIASRWKALSESGRGGFEELAQDYPLDLAVLAAVGQMAGGDRPVGKKAGGYNAESGGSVTPVKPLTGQEVMAHPTPAYKELHRIEQAKKEGIELTGTEEATKQAKLDIATWKKSTGRRRAKPDTASKASAEYLVGAEAAEATQKELKRMRKEAADRDKQELKDARDLSQRMKIAYDPEDLVADPLAREAAERPYSLRAKAPALTSLYDVAMNRGYAMGGLRDRLLQAKIQKAYDAGDILTGQSLQGQLEQSRGGWNRASSLSDLPGIAASAKSVTKVGEQGPEALVDLMGGGQFIVPGHQMSPFMQLLQAKRLPAKDLTGKQAGGWHRVRGFSGTGWPEEGFVEPPPPTNQGVGPAGLRIMGEGAGTYAQRRGLADVHSLQAGTASTLGTMSATIQRVHVVNWPSSFGAAQQQQQQRAQTLGSPAQPFAAQSGIGPTPSGTGGTGTVGTGTGGGTGGGTAPVMTGQGVDEKLRRGSAAGSTVKFAAEEATYDLSSRLSKVGTDISESLQKSPVRALSVAMGQIAQTMVGGRAGILERARGAQLQERRAGVAVRELISSEEQLGRAEFEREAFGRRTQGMTFNQLSQEDQQRLGELNANLQTAQARLAEVRPVAEERVVAAEKAAGGILSPAQQVKAQVVGLGGIVGGTILFTAAMQAAQIGLQLLGDVTTKAVDALDDFGFTARNMRTDMAEAIRGASGDIRGAVAGYAGQVGLPAGVDISALQQQAGIEAGARALAQQRDLLRSQDYFANNRSGVIPGLGAGLANGILGTFINQTPGVAQVLSSQLPEVPEEGERTPGTSSADALKDLRTFRRELQADYASQAAGLGAIPPSSALALPSATSQKQFWETLSNSTGESLKALKALTPEEIGRKVVTASMQSGALGPSEGSRLEQQLSGLSVRIADPISAARDQALDDFDKRIEEWQQSLDKMDSGFKIIAGTSTQVSDSLKALSATGPEGQGLGEALAAQGRAIVQNGRGIASGFQGNQFLETLGNAALQPTFEQLLAQQQSRILPAQMRAMGRQFELQRQMVSSGAFESMIANPFPSRLGTGIVPRGSTFPGAERLGAARTEFNAAAAQGEDILRNILGEGGMGEKEIDSAIDGVKSLGTEIANLNQRSQDMQLGLEVAEYNEQIRIAVRGVGDLVALTGQQSKMVDGQVIQGSRYGQMQRAQIQDSRELARIQLARSQRELNLQLALARLRSPGETAAERAVRRREAEMMAREQQRELTINKRTTGRGFAIQDIEFGRQLTDAVKQLGLLRQGRAVSIEVRGIQRIIEARERLLQVRQAFLGAGRDAGVAMINFSNQLVADFESKLGKITDSQIKELKSYVRRSARALNGLTGPEDGGAGAESTARSGWYGDTGGGGRRRTGRGSHAAGFLGTVGTPTTMTFGEAGAETVAILRNPRMMGASAGGLGGARSAPIINLNITLNNEISGAGDEDRLVRKIVRRLHEEAAILVS